jgi:hypothetical protein
VVKLAASILVVFGMTSAFATENERRAAESAECKVITARLMEATNAEVDRYSPSGDKVVLKAPKMVLSCTNRRLTGISMDWNANGFPPDEWFGLLAKAGKAVTGIDVSILETASRKCHEQHSRTKPNLRTSTFRTQKSNVRLTPATGAA